MGACVVGFLLAQPAYSQICPCDYFSASQNAEIAGYLNAVEVHHVDTVPNSIRVGRLDVAIGDLNYALERFPNHPQALQLVGMVAQMRKQTPVAISFYQKAINLYPQYALTRAQYGLFLVTTGDVDGGIQMLKQSVEMDPKAPAGYAGLAHAYAKKGDRAKAGEAANKARELGFNGKLPDGL
jgi:predicted Zn-dependent protease